MSERDIVHYCHRQADLIAREGHDVTAKVLIDAASGILSLRAQLAEARDKALDEAAAVARSYQWSDTVPAWAVIQNAILNLKGNKP